MNLWDELRQMHPFNESPRLLDAVIEKIKRALAAERAEMKCGHPHACLKTRPFVPSDYPYEPPLSRTEEFCTACERLAVERAATIEECKSAAIVPGIAGGRALENLPRNRSALEDATKMAAAQARHEMNQKIGEHLGQDANEKSTPQMLDDALAQARRGQREKDAQIATAAANERATAKGYEVGDWIAAAILAQGD